MGLGRAGRAWRASSALAAGIKAKPPELVEAYVSGKADYYGMYKRKFAGASCASPLPRACAYRHHPSASSRSCALHPTHPRALPSASSRR